MPIIQDKRKLILKISRLSRSTPPPTRKIMIRPGFIMSCSGGLLARATRKAISITSWDFDFNIEAGSGKRITDDKQQIGDYAAFLSVQYDPLKWMTIQPGIRYIYNTKYQAPLVYSINLKFAFLENYSIRASYSRGFRAPSLKGIVPVFC